MKISKFLLNLSVITASVLVTTNVAIAEENLVQEAVVIVNAPGHVEGVAMVKATATVQKIDKETRTITLKKEHDEIVNIVAPDTVRNFDQIKVGDVVHAQYETSVTFQVNKEVSTEVGRVEQGAVARAKLGDKPGAVMTRAVAIRANVTKVDMENKKITIQGKNKTLDLDIKNPEHFKVVKVGDQIDALITEAIAISVTEAEKE